MLILARWYGHGRNAIRLRTSDGIITIKLLRPSRDGVKVGVRAPADVEIWREEHDEEHEYQEGNSL